MNSGFFLQLPSNLDPAAPASLAWLDGRDGSSGRDAPEVIAEKAAGARLVAIAPIQDVVLLEAELPAANRQRLIKAAPFALEERLAADVETLHFAFPADMARGRTLVAVTDKARMTKWRQGLEAAGLDARAIVPAALATPLENDEWSLLADAEAVLLRTGPEAAAAMPARELATLLELTRSQIPSDQGPARLRFFRTDDAENPEPTIRQFCERFDIEAVEDSERNPLAVYRRGIDAGPRIDLMQGEFARTDRSARLWRPWRAAAALLAAFMLLQLTSIYLDHRRLSQEDEQLSARIEAIYRETFPDARNVVDPRLQMQRHLDAMRQTDAEDPLLQRLSDVGPVLNAAGSGQLLALRYKRPDLRLELRLADFQALDKLKSALQAVDGIEPVLGAANAEADGVRTEIRL